MVILWLLGVFYVGFALYYISLLMRRIARKQKTAPKNCRKKSVNTMVRDMKRERDELRALEPRVRGV
jgi:hypothetical protein